MYPEHSGSRFFRNIGTVLTKYLIDWVCKGQTALCLQGQVFWKNALCCGVSSSQWTDCAWRWQWQSCKMRGFFNPV